MQHEVLTHSYWSAVILGVTPQKQIQGEIKLTTMAVLGASVDMSPLGDRSEDLVWHRCC